MTLKVSLGRAELDAANELLPRGEAVVTLLVAIPECAAVEVSDYAVNEPRQAQANRGQNGKCAKLVRVSRMRKQNIAIVALDAFDLYQRLGRHEAVALEVILHFDDITESVPRGLGPFARATSRIIVQEDVAPKHATSARRSATTPGQVVWAAGANWQEALNAAIAASTDYLMIAADELSDSLVHELASKRAEFNGMNVTIVRMSQIDSTPDSEASPPLIRGFVKDLYDSESAAHTEDGLLSHVLLIGDAARPDSSVVIPTYYGFESPSGVDNEQWKAADSYYSLLSEENAEDDIFPDVLLGRIPADAESYDSPPDPEWELRNVVSKILRYEPDSATLPKTLIVSGGNQVGLPPFVPYFGYLLNRYAAVAPIDTLHRNVYPQENPHDTDGPLDVAFSELVADKLNSDEYRIFGYFDHGNTFYFPESFFPQHYDVLETVNSLPLGLFIGSHVGRFDLPLFNDINSGYPSTTTSVPSLITPTAAIDSCDALPERLVLQENGLIGAIAFSRTGSSDFVAQIFTSMFDAIFKDHAFTLGEVLMATRLLMFPLALGGSNTIVAFDRGLTLFGDPALNIMWERAALEADTVDLSVSSSDIRPLGGVKGKYFSASAVNVAVGLRNKGTGDAADVAFDVWDGVPGVGSLKASGAVDHIAAMNGVAWDTVTVSGLSNGITQLYVQVDTSQYAEPTYRNNTASAEVYAYDYASGFPIAAPARVSQSVTLGELSEDDPGRELLFQCEDGLRCYGANGEMLWYVPSQLHATGSPKYLEGSDLANGTPSIANVFKDGKPCTAFIDSLLYIVDGGGTAIAEIAIDPQFWANPPYSHYRQQALLFVDLVADDDSLEVVTIGGVFPAGFQKRVTAYKLDGTTLWERRLGGLSSYSDAHQVAVGDLDADGAPEIVVRVTANTSTADSTYCIRSNGTLAWRTAGSSLIGSFDNVRLVPTASDDGFMDAWTTVATNVGGRVRWNVVRINATGDQETLVSQVGTSLQATATITVHDVNDSGARFVVGADSSLLLFDENASEVAAFRTSRAPLLCDALAANVDSDPDTEFIAVSGSVELMIPKRSAMYVHVLDDDLSLITEFAFPFRPDVDVDEFGSPAICDVDGDGSVELVFASLDSVIHAITLGPAGSNAWSQRCGDAMLTNNIEQPVVGTYTEDMSLFNRVNVIGDAQFLGQVYIDGTAHMRVLDDDVSAAGQDATRVEMFFHGGVRAIGSELQPVRFDGWDGAVSSNDPSAWWGIFLSDSMDASGELVHCDIRNAALGLQSTAPVSIRHCLIEDCDALGISVAGAGSVTVDSTVIRGADYGINAVDGIDLVLTNSTIEDCDLYGVAVYKDSRLEAEGTTFNGNDIGLYLAREAESWVSGIVRECEFNDNGDGIWIDDTGDSAVVVEDCVIDNSTTSGVYVEGAGDVTLRSNTITNGGVGVYSNGSDPHIGSRNVIQYNGGGITCDNYSYAVVESSTVNNNNGGVFIVNNADPDLGHATGGASTGYNIFRPTTNYFVTNFTSNTIKAENNYWPFNPPTVCLPKSTKFYGSVDYTPYLCTEPSLAAPAIAFVEPDAEERIPAKFGLGLNYPNPFNPTTTVVYEVPAPGHEVQIAVFDVAGRRVATLVNEPRAPGVHRALWDGRNDAGRVVASGVYFLRMQAGRYVQTRKLLMLK